MKRSLVLLILSALLAFGCSKQTSPNEQPKPAPEPEAKPTPPAKKAPETESALPVGHDPVACKADDECELSHLHRRQVLRSALLGHQHIQQGDHRPAQGLARKALQESGLPGGVLHP